MVSTFASDSLASSVELPAHKAVAEEPPPSNVCETNPDVNDTYGGNKDDVPSKLFVLVNAKAVESTARSDERDKDPTPPKLIRGYHLYSSLRSPETKMYKLD